MRTFRAVWWLVFGTLAGCPAEPPDLPGADATAAASTAATDTGSAGSVDATAGEESTGVVGSICGDGIEQGGEDCDDANADELDGCTSSCRIGPIGIELSGEPTTSTAIGVGRTPLTGTPAVSCPDGQVVKGVDAMLDVTFVGLALHCGIPLLLDADPTAVLIGPGEDPAPLGQGGEPHDLGCSVNAAVTEIAGGGMGAMDVLAATCRLPQVVGTGASQTVELGEAMAVPEVGPGNAADLRTACPPGTVATGINTGLTDAGLSTISLQCDGLALVFG